MYYRDLRLTKGVKNPRWKAIFVAAFWPFFTTCWSQDKASEPGSPMFGEDVVTLSAETAGLFSIANSNDYRYLPQLITVGWQLDEIGNDGWTRGNTEFLFSGMYAPVTHGPNPWFTGGLFGPRYNFIQEGWPVIPYLESRVGFMFTNATGATDSQGQDFCFSFTIGAGVRIPVMDRLSVNLGVLYQHISNGGLSEPETENVGLDSIGPTLSVSWAF